MTIFDIVSDLEKLNSALQEDLYGVSDEDIDSMIESLDALEMEKFEKIKNTVSFYKNINAQTEALKGEVVKLKKKQDTLERMSGRLKQYLTVGVPEGEKWTDGIHTVSYRKSTRTIVTNEHLMPDNCFKTVRKLSLSTVKSQIESGDITEGAYIETNQNIQVK